MKEKISEALKDQFRPEFLNRIDDIIIFNYLRKTEIQRPLGLSSQLNRAGDKRVGGKKVEQVVA